MARDGRDRPHGDGMIAADEDREIAGCQDFEPLVAGPGCQIEHVGAAFLGQAPTGWAGAECWLGAPQIAVIDHHAVQVQQRFCQARNAQRFRPHAGAADRGSGSGGYSQQVDTLVLGSHGAVLVVRAHVADMGGEGKATVDCHIHPAAKAQRCFRRSRISCVRAAINCHICAKVDLCRA
jgi:hypothetical protein